MFSAKRRASIYAHKNGAKNQVIALIALTKLGAPKENKGFPPYHFDHPEALGRTGLIDNLTFLSLRPVVKAFRHWPQSLGLL